MRFKLIETLMESKQDQKAFMNKFGKDAFDQFTNQV